MVDVRDPEWLDCVRSVLNGVFAYARTPEIDSFMDEFRTSRHWRNEFFWTYGHYIVRRHPSHWFALLKSFETEIEADREAFPDGYRRRLQTFAHSVGVEQIAKQFMALTAPGAPRFLLDDLTEGLAPVLAILPRGDTLILELGGRSTQFTPKMRPGTDAAVEREVAGRFFGFIGSHTRSAEDADVALLDQITATVRLGNGRMTERQIFGRA